MKKWLVVSLVMAAMTLSLPGVALANDEPAREIRGPVFLIDAFWQGLLAIADAMLDTTQENGAIPDETPSTPDNGEEAAGPSNGPSPPEEMGGGTDPLG